MKRVIITMPASILANYSTAKRQLIWEPRAKTCFCFLQLGWSGGKSRKDKQPQSAPARLAVVR